MAHDSKSGFSSPDVEAHCEDQSSHASLKTSSQSASPSTDTLTSPRTHDLTIIPIPRRVQYDPANPPQLTLFLNILFAVTATVFVANQYYCQPLLIQLSQSFNVTYDDVSNVPTLIQAGYTAGLLFITTLGDLVRRRPLVLLLTSTTFFLTLGTAYTRNFVVFQVLSTLTGVVTCASQVLAPLIADLAAPERRASALSILIAGVLLAMLYARVLAGLIAEFSSWRIVYYVASGLQAANIVVLYFVMPDYPVKNKGLSYWTILYTLGKYSVTEPQLIQACLVCMVSKACFTNFWVTLTFLLGGPPYYYSTLVIGLFGLVGILGALVAPVVGRTVDHLLPWLAAVVATVGLIVFQAIQTGAGGVHIAAVVIVCFGIDVFRQFQQVSLNTIVFAIEPAARSRMNAILQIAVFVGQIMGTSVGSRVFLKYGWRPAAALSVAWSAFTLLVLFARGPHCRRYTWLGYEGGCDFKKRPAEDVEKQTVSMPDPETQSKRESHEFNENH